VSPLHHGRSSQRKGTKERRGLAEPWASGSAERRWWPCGHPRRAPPGTAKPADAARLSGCAESQYQRWGMLYLESAPTALPRGPIHSSAIRPGATTGACTLAARTTGPGRWRVPAAHRCHRSHWSLSDWGSSHRSLRAEQLSPTRPRWLPRAPRSQQTLRVLPAALRAGPGGGKCCIFNLHAPVVLVRTPPTPNSPDSHGTPRSVPRRKRRRGRRRWQGF